jgi:hypothetical protein
MAPMDVAAELERAREAHRRLAWADACAGFAAVDEVSPLDIDDLERLAEGAQMLGRGDEATRLLQRVYHVHVGAGAVGAAMRCAFWLSQVLVHKGEPVQAGGWLVRAGRLTETAPDCAELGYVLVPQAAAQLREGDAAAAFATASGAAELAGQCGDRDLATLAANVQGQARIKQGRVEEGLALLDEAMVAVAAGETSPRVTGWTYCDVIATCHELNEVHRGREWTLALNAWCDALPQFTGPYSGICRIHRAELLQLGGAGWSRLPRPTTPSPPSCSSARRPWPATSATSSPSSASARAPPPRPTPSSTGSADPAATQNYPSGPPGPVGWFSRGGPRRPASSVEAHHDAGGGGSCPVRNGSRR